MEAQPALGEKPQAATSVLTDPPMLTRHRGTRVTRDRGHAAGLRSSRSIPPSLVWTLATLSQRRKQRCDADELGKEEQVPVAIDAALYGYVLSETGELGNLARIQPVITLDDRNRPANSLEPPQKGEITGGAST